ncbi:MAG: PilZ domain-containing protein [Candidatus Acidiferrales bacterium]
MAETKASSPGTPKFAEQRRTQRVRIAMPVLIRGKNGNQSFEEETHTLLVNAHGCLIFLGVGVARGQQISIVNPKTAEELPGTVIFLGQKEDGKTQVGIEFAEPSPLFWRIVFPPEDWDPATRKRPGPVPPAATPTG